MAKLKNRKLTSKKPKQAKSSRPNGITKSSKSSNSHTQEQHSAPTIPFHASDRILLLGDGDLSFARSLVEYLESENVVATVYEKENELKEKYPNAEENARAIEEGGGSVKYGVDATKMGSVWREQRGKVDRVVFNFPHVGGKSTDVNRQVRYNQELLVAFFKNALQVLAPSTSALVPSSSSKASGDEKTSSIIVTLFEGHPYTLWNIRDLGRHSGLQVEKSFQFQAAAYPVYRHARTLGVVRGKDGKQGGGWRGEERSARSYVFVRRGEGSVVVPGKRKIGESSDDEDGEEEDGGKHDEDDWSPRDIENAVHPSRRSNISGS